MSFPVTRLAAILVAVAVGLGHGLTRALDAQTCTVTLPPDDRQRRGTVRGTGAGQGATHIASQPSWSALAYYNCRVRACIVWLATARIVEVRLFVVPTRGC
ncbi:hypothetical protein DAEQUDRAFT_237922 [Daedalea quercina L-15889]|uniref:Secreted protein n=1 Tax=Daedalea quercina L-15889 TaxID=1314783 RepID=A0A165QXG0_9APHY|nr:hypothetical protein DAEQUDRAFT_237922 [Daedalea quercina L-15889]